MHMHVNAEIAIIPILSKLMIKLALRSLTIYVYATYRPGGIFNITQCTLLKTRSASIYTAPDAIATYTSSYMYNQARQK